MQREKFSHFCCNHFVLQICRKIMCFIDSLRRLIWRWFVISFLTFERNKHTSEWYLFHLMIIIELDRVQLEKLVRFRINAAWSFPSSIREATLAFLYSWPRLFITPKVLWIAFRSTCWLQESRYLPRCSWRSISTKSHPRSTRRVTAQNCHNATTTKIGNRYTFLRVMWRRLEDDFRSNYASQIQLGKILRDEKHCHCRHHGKALSLSYKIWPRNGVKK